MPASDEGFSMRAAEQNDPMTWDATGYLPGTRPR